MRIKILHTADLHLGRMNFNIRERLVDFSQAAMKIWDIAVHEKVDLVIMAGDVFDSPEPDPYSAWAFSKLCSDLQREKIQVVAVVGNHDSHKLSDVSGSKCSWIKSLFPSIISEVPGDGAFCGVSRITFPGKDPSMGLRLVALDWMPSQKCRAVLNTVPPDVDVLVMHQSCSGFMPTIAVPEIELESLAGKAKYVAMGDLHISRSMHPSEETIVAYPGSIEMCKSDEDPEKYVNIVEYDLAERLVVGVSRQRIHCRGITSITIRTPEDLVAARESLAETEEASGLVVFKYESEMADAVEKLSDAMRMEGKIMSSHLQSLPKIIATETFSSSKDSADMEMSEILAERFEKDSIELSAAVDLWNNPDNADQILQQLESQLNEDQESKTGQLLPA
jgi:DNA repair exonuclease SbcCD nuclease subunit